MRGEFAEDRYKFVASLQLDGKHICSSGLFQVNLLLTTGECAWCIEYGMKNEKLSGSAVLGHSNLKKGQRVDILKFAHNPRFKICNAARVNNFHDFAVILVGWLKGSNNMIELIGNWAKAYYYSTQKID